jgi:hypothetical protein
MKIDTILLIVCVISIISIVVYVLTSKVERLDLIDTSDNNPLISGIKNMKSGLDKLGDFVKMLDGGVQQVLGDIKKAFEPQTPGRKSCPSDMTDRDGSCWKDSYGRGAGRDADYEPCPNGSSANWAGDCMANQTDREDGRNDAEPLWKANDLKWTREKGHYRDGCSWNRHEEGGMCFRACPQGYFGRAHDKCWGNGADSFGVMKRLVHRARTCNADEDKDGIRCYPRCKSGYKPAGCCLCEPNDGPGGIRIWPTDRYECPPPGNTTHTKLTGVLCYKP